MREQTQDTEATSAPWVITQPKEGPKGVGVTGPWGMFWGQRRLGLERWVELFLGEP